MGVSFAGQPNVTSGTHDSAVPPFVDAVNFHARGMVGDGVVFTPPEDDAFGNAIAVPIALSFASVGAEDVLSRFVVHNETIHPARDDFPIAEPGTVFPTSFAMPMERA